VCLNASFSLNNQPKAAEDERNSHQKTASAAIHGKKPLFLLTAAVQTTFVQRFPYSARVMQDILAE
jgi:hypothetical protein